MSYFTSDFIAFFKELAANNNKAWFDANRQRYEKSVKQPFQEFVDEMIIRIRADDPSVDITSKDAIMRINRDIRFSKDKTPYKTHVAAIISPGGKKDKSVPGNYIHLDAEHIRIYGGAHFLEKEQLQRVRTAIAENLDTFSKLINEPEFKRKFATLRGEQHKRLPEEFRAAAEKQPLIANKQFYYFAKLDAKHILDSNLTDTLMEYYFAGKHVNQFFK